MSFIFKKKFLKKIPLIYTDTKNKQISNKKYRLTLLYLKMKQTEVFQ